MANFRFLHLALTVLLVVTVDRQSCTGSRQLYTKYLHRIAFLARAGWQPLSAGACSNCGFAELLGSQTWTWTCSDELRDEVFAPEPCPNTSEVTFRRKCRCRPDLHTEFGRCGVLPENFPAVPKPRSRRTPSEREFVAKRPTERASGRRRSAGSGRRSAGSCRSDDWRCEQSNEVRRLFAKLLPYDVDVYAAARARRAKMYAAGHVEDEEQWPGDGEERSDDEEKRSDDVQKRSDDEEKRSDDVQKRSDDVQKRSDDVQKHSDDVQKRSDDVQKHSDDVQKRSEDVQKRDASTLPQPMTVEEMRAEKLKRTGPAEAVQWQVKVALTEDDGFVVRCSGYLVAPQWVLTSKRCVQRDNWPSDRVFVYVKQKQPFHPDFSLDGGTFEWSRFAVTDIFIHPNYTDQYEGVDPARFFNERDISTEMLKPPVGRTEDYHEVGDGRSAADFRNLALMRLHKTTSNMHFLCQKFRPDIEFQRPIYVMAFNEDQSEKQVIRMRWIRPCYGYNRILKFFFAPESSQHLDISSFGAPIVARSSYGDDTLVLVGLLSGRVETCYTRRDDGSGWSETFAYITEDLFAESTQRWMVDVVRRFDV